MISTMNRYIFISLFVVFGCSQQPAATTASDPQPEATSFTGQPLYPRPATPEALAKSDSIIATIRSKDQLSEEDYVDIGRQLAITSRFKMALENYTEGLKTYPESFKLLRHRGHRYLNLRQPDLAIKDLEKANSLITGQPETWEFDAAGKQTATYQHQIWYHIGLYHFMKKDYTASASAFEKSLATTNEGDDIAGASDWLYNSYQRAGQVANATKVLEPFSADFDIEDKNYPYFRRLLLFKGLITPEELIDNAKPIDSMSLTDATKLYGLGNWYKYQGQQDKADEIYAKVRQSKEWPAFAVACAELE